MFQDLIKAVQDGVKTESIEIQGKHFTTRQVYPVAPDDTVNTLAVKSLSGLVDYLVNQTDDVNLDRLFIHVLNEKQVYVFDQVKDKFGDDGRRHCWIKAETDLKQFEFGRWYDPENFNISLQTLFIRNDDLLDVIDTVSNLKATEAITNSDDGLSQEVIVQKRINSEQIKIKNPVLLRPIRTFTEIEQPESPFILRIKREGESIYAALYEADNGKWRNNACQNIKDYLVEHLWSDEGKGITILA